MPLLAQLRVDVGVQYELRKGGSHQNSVFDWRDHCCRGGDGVQNRHPDGQGVEELYECSAPGRAEQVVLKEVHNVGAHIVSKFPLQSYTHSS